MSDAGFGDYVMHFGLSTPLGNIVGGSGIFALISHAQLRGDEDRAESSQA